MKAFLALSRAIGLLNELVGKSVAWLILASILISATNAVTRKAFNLSSNAWLEAQWYLFSAAFLLGSAWTLMSNEHVRVDLVYSRLGRRAQIVVDIIGTVLFLLPFCVVVVWMSWPVFLAKLASGETSNNTGGLILWPAWMLIPVGYTLLGLQGISELIKRIAWLRGDLPDPVVQADAAAAEL
ncbi:TRAP transporter small permease subunit [Paracoccus sulfuroxidans]|uniref:TRAP transporter small permease protein n=1 Tax=Paracoccus sulfuroxidans TaxID=384678 RepID=A0A562N7W2_9RHOB|nr:TRAP transporter small permease subunit [Paracoccus sulfuroxidans]TWI28193.1 TRAP-type mannitol/chloroaromatic compound transport system permease small subunit [Paracoccus sulfuroxidans]